MEDIRIRTTPGYVVNTHRLIHFQFEDAISLAPTIKATRAKETHSSLSQLGKELAQAIKLRTLTH